MGRIDENELRALFEEIEVPAGLDRWRDRIADVHVEAYERESDDEPEPAEPDDAGDPDPDTKTNGADIVALPVGGELRPARQRRRSVAMAEAAAVVVGLAGIVVTTTLLSETPPADPTMIIDGPDKTVTSAPLRPTEASSNPSGPSTTPPPDAAQGQPGPGGTRENPAGGSTGTMENRPTAGNEPNWPAMVGDPTAANTGVPLGATLGDHYGDLRITTAGQVVSDLRVTGTVIVDAPNVTLKRVLIVAPYGAPAVRQNAAGLTVVNSELTGGSSLIQAASGLTVNRSRLQVGMTITSGAQLFDNFVDTADVLVTSGATTVVLRHNTMGRVTMNDLDAPIRGVTVENNLLNEVDFPTAAGSAGIHVVGNRFRGSAPSTGWNPSAPDYQWSNNTNADSGAPVNP